MSDRITQGIRWWIKEQFDVPVPKCDVCDGIFIKFPVCIRGGKALCARCQRESGINDGDNEYFETIEYNVGAEPPKPVVNFGGRKV